MRSSALTAILLGAAASASASSLLARQDSYPTCALTCIASPNIGDCSSVSDTHCLCTNETFVSTMTKCITDACTGKDLQTALTFSQGLCLKVGVTLTASGVPAPTGSATATTASGSSSATATAPASAKSSAAAASSSGSASGSAASASASAKSAAGSSHEVNTHLGLFAAGLAFFAL